MLVDLVDRERAFNLSRQICIVSSSGTFVNSELRSLTPPRSVLFCTGVCHKEEASPTNHIFHGKHYKGFHNL